jgi:hypothetical protein
MKSARHRKDRPLGGVNGTVNGKGTLHPVVCEACLKPLPPGRQGTKRFCSSDCRLLSWAVDALIKALKEGKAEGLRGKVNAIAGGLKVEVVHTWDGRQPS